MVKQNIVIGCGNNRGAEDLKTYSSGPGFVDLAAMNLTLRDDAAVYADVRKFQRIPFVKIGLYTDQFRPNLPPYRHELAEWQPGQNASAYDILDRQ